MAWVLTPKQLRFAQAVGTSLGCVEEISTDAPPINTVPLHGNPNPKALHIMGEAHPVH
jgi:hypothetical protein